MDMARVTRGLGYGMAATVVMSIPMIAAAIAGVAPMPEPIPVAIVGKIMDGGLPRRSSRCWRP